jgi:hypothetical protein
LDGLPDGIVQSRDRRGNVVEVKGFVITGFIRDGVFYTRQEAARIMENETREKQSSAEA